jgi:hypothetical protein
MSVRSPLNRAARGVFLLALTLAGPCMADRGIDDDGPDDPLLKYRSTARHHGLYEIHAEARRFLRSQPPKSTGAWVAAGPDIRMQAPRCAMPLRSRWARKSDNTENLPGVLVICKKTVNKSDPSWSIFIDAYVPAERQLEVQRKFPGFSGERAPDQK